MKKLLVLLVALIATLLVPLPAAHASPGLLASTNDERSTAGLAPLARRGDLDAVAQAWSNQMARTGVLQHNPSLHSQVQGWSRIGENVGYGASESVVHTALMNSAGHRANILSPLYSEVGFGVAVKDGRVWVTQVFRTPAGAVPPPVMVRGSILDRYTSLGGARGFLGRVVTPEQVTPVRGGRYNHFAGGSIYWHPATGAWEVHGGIRNLWAAKGWETSSLGFPVSNEIRLTAGALSRFERGSIYWSPATGAHEVRGSILQAWGAMRYENGGLGYPTTDEWPTPGRPGAFNHFSGGSVYWSPTTGAWPVWGGFRDTWSRLGWEGSRLGFPRSGEYRVAVGARQDFQGGHLVWNRQTSAVTVVYT